MKIGEVAKAAGIGIDAIRFYERSGYTVAGERPRGTMYAKPLRNETQLIASATATDGGVSKG